MAININVDAAGVKGVLLDRALWDRTNKVVLSRTTTLPLTPTDGEIYIVPSDDLTNPNKIAFYSDDVGDWLLLTPDEGWQAYVVDDKENVQFDGTTWQSFSSTISLGSGGKVRAATTANITISTALNNGDTLDGVSLVTGNLVLVKNQSTTSQNGIYVVGATPERAPAFDTYDEHPGSLIVVEEGTTNADTLWLCTSNKGGTLDSTAIAYTSISLSGAVTTARQILSGAGLTGGGDLSADRTLAMTADQRTRDIFYIIDGGGATITTGIKGDVQVDFACTILSATLLADQSGSIVIDVWKDTYANYPPTVADTITASAKPTLSTATKSTDSTLTGWTTSIAAGDTIRFNVDSVSTVTRVVIILKVRIS